MEPASAKLYDFVKEFNFFKDFLLGLVPFNSWGSADRSLITSSTDLGKSSSSRFLYGTRVSKIIIIIGLCEGI